MECMKCDYYISDISIDYLAHNLEDITLVWFDPLLKEDTFNIPKLNDIRALNDYVLFYTKESLFLEWLMSKKGTNEYVIIILRDFEILDKIHECDQIYAILILTSQGNINRITMANHHYSKVVGIFEDQNSMLVHLQKVIIDVENQVNLNAEDVFCIYNQEENAWKDLRNHSTSFLWWIAFKNTVKVMPHTSEAKTEMLEKCRSYYSGNQSQLSVIDEFELNYNANNAIRWYTKSCFLYRLLNKALRTEDIKVLYTFRYFIIDLCASLEAAHDKNTIKRVYRGSKMSRDEVEHYSIGIVVATTGFLSTTLDINVANQFVGIDSVTGKPPRRTREDHMQFALYEIDIDQDLSSDIVLADISDQSFFPDEKEVLFDLGTTFEITEIRYDYEHCFWFIQMRPSLKGLQLYQEYKSYIHQQIIELTPTIVFGTLLIDTGAYEQSITYFERLLSQTPDDYEARCKVYYSVARAYRFMDEHEKALELFRRAEKRQRAGQPKSNFDLARTLAGIASVYYELHDYQQELFYYQESMIIFQEIFPEKNHIEIARSFNRLGFAYTNQHQYMRALEYLSNAQIVYNKTVPSGHAGMAQVLYNMGVIHQALGQTDEAVNFYQEALKMREIVLPPYHFSLGQSCYRLSVLYEEQGQYDSALEYAQRALTIYEKKPLHNQKLIHEVQNIIGCLHNKSTIQL